MVIPSEISNFQADVIFVIEGTAVNKEYLNEIKCSYVIPILEYFSEGSLDHYDWHCKGTDVNYGMVVYYASDCLPRPCSTSYGPYSNPQKLLNVLDSLELDGGSSESHANIAEGFSTALHCFDDLEDLREPNVSPQKFCILIANSPPYLFPVMESTKFSGYNVEQLASMFPELGVHLSIVAPRKIPALYNLFEKAGGELHSSNYAKEAYHLVLLKGFSWLQQPVLLPSLSQSASAVKAALPNSILKVEKIENDMSSPVGHFATQRTKLTPKDVGVYMEPSGYTVTRIKEEPISHIKEEHFSNIKQENVVIIKQEPDIIMQYQKSSPAPQQSVILPYSNFTYQQNSTATQPSACQWSDSPSNVIPMSREPSSTVDRTSMSQLTTATVGLVPLVQNVNSNSTVVSGQQLSHSETNTLQRLATIKPFQSTQGNGQMEHSYQEGVTVSSQQFVPQTVIQHNFHTPVQGMDQSHSGNPPTNVETFPRDRSVMWQGTLEWTDRMRSPTSNERILRSAFCQILPNPRHGELDLKAETWPRKIKIQLMPKNLLGDVGNEYLRNSKCLLFRIQEYEELQTLKTVLSNSCVGCINIVSTCQRCVIILLYAKDSFVGLIPNDQAVFLDHLRKVLHQQKNIKDLQKLVAEQAISNTRESQGGVETSGLLTLQEAVQLSASESVLSESMRHEQLYSTPPAPPMYQRSMFAMSGCQITQLNTQQQQHLIPFSQQTAGVSSAQPFYMQTSVLTDNHAVRNQIQATSSVAVPFQDAQHNTSRIQIHETSTAGGQIIWHGVLEWTEKGKNTIHNVVQSVFCQVKAAQGQPSVRVDTWPQKLVMQLIPKTVIGKIGGSYLQNSKSLLFEPQPCEAVESLKRIMCSGYAGCVQIMKSGDNGILVMLYTADKNCFIGFLPNDQATFLDQFRKTIQAVKQMQQPQYQQVPQMQMDSSRGQQLQNSGYQFQ